MHAGIHTLVNLGIFHSFEQNTPTMQNSSLKNPKAQDCAATFNSDFLSALEILESHVTASLGGNLDNKELNIFCNCSIRKIQRWCKGKMVYFCHGSTTAFFIF